MTIKYSALVLAGLLSAASMGAMAADVPKTTEGSAMKAQPSMGKTNTPAVKSTGINGKPGSTSNGADSGTTDGGPTPAAGSKGGGSASGGSGSGGAGGGSGK